MGLVLGGLVVLLVIVALVGSIHAVSLEHRIHVLDATVQRAADEAENNQVAQAHNDLSSAESSLVSINSTLHNSPDFVILNLLPVARQNVQALRAATDLGIQLVSGGQQLFYAASPLQGPTGHLDVSLVDGQVPTSEIRAVQAVLGPLISSLPTSVNPPSGRLVLGPIRSAERRLWAEAVRKRAELANVNNALTVLNDLTGGDGDRRYLIAVANTAEMRGAGGIILSYGVLQASGGKVTLGPFGPISDLALSQPVPNTFPADFTRQFADLYPTTLWQDATVMSDFTVDAPVLEAMYQQATGLPVNGVIQVDPAGLAAILQGTGPIQDPVLGTVDAANVVPLTLNQAYFQFANRPARQNFLQGVAQEAFQALTSGRFLSLRPLGTAIVRAGADRHIVVASTDPASQAAIGSLGFSGAMPQPSSAFTQLTVQNYGTNKLDYYLQSSMRLDGSWPVGAGTGRAQVTVNLTNTAPSNTSTPAEVFGPNPPETGPPGEYHGLVTVYLPAGSSLQGSQLDATAGQLQSGTQNGIAAFTYQLTLPAGDRSHVVLDVTLPPRPKGNPVVYVVPTPRVIPTVTTVAIPGVRTAPYSGQLTPNAGEPSSPVTGTGSSPAVAGTGSSGGAPAEPTPPVTGISGPAPAASITTNGAGEEQVRPGQQITGTASDANGPGLLGVLVYYKNLATGAGGVLRATCDSCGRGQTSATWDLPITPSGPVPPGTYEFVAQAVDIDANFGGASNTLHSLVLSS